MHSISSGLKLFGKLWFSTHKIITKIYCKIRKKSLNFRYYSKNELSIIKFIIYNNDPNKYLYKNIDTFPNQKKKYPKSIRINLITSDNETLHHCHNKRTSKRTHAHIKHAYKFALRQQPNTKKASIYFDRWQICVSRNARRQVHE